MLLIESGDRMFAPSALLSAMKRGTTVALIISKLAAVGRPGSPNGVGEPHWRHRAEFLSATLWFPEDRVRPDANRADDLIVLTKVISPQRVRGLLEDAPHPLRLVSRNGNGSLIANAFDLWLDRYRVADPDRHDHVELWKAWKTNTPRVYLIGLDVYFPIWSVFIVADDPHALTFAVRLADATSPRRPAY